MNKFIIGLDVDGVIADFVGKVLYYQNSIFKTNFKHSDITSYHIESIIGATNLETILKVMETNQDCKYFDLIPGALELVSFLKQLGKVVFVTAPCTRYRAWADDRLFWLNKHFSAKRHDVISISDKTLFIGNILIDDSSANINSWLSTNRTAIKVSQPWNQEPKSPFVKCVDNLSEIPDIIMDVKYSGGYFI